MLRAMNRGEYLFGGNREIAIKRDGEKCVRCSMTREQHKTTYGFDITVDHIDGRGTGKPMAEKNNDLSNLQTLCCSCHGKKDVVRRGEIHRPLGAAAAGAKLHDFEVREIRALQGIFGSPTVAKMYGVTGTPIRKIWSGKSWKNLLTEETQ